MASENVCNIDCGCTHLEHLGNTAQIESVCFISQGSQASTESTENVIAMGCFMQSFAENGVKMPTTLTVAVLALNTLATQHK